jgi:hypothetical protein
MGIWVLVLTMTVLSAAERWARVSDEVVRLGEMRGNDVLFAMPEPRIFLALRLTSNRRTHGGGNPTACGAMYSNSLASGTCA